MIHNAALCPSCHPLLDSVQPAITVSRSDGWLLEELAAAGLAYLESTLTEHDRTAHLAALRQLQAALVGRVHHHAEEVAHVQD